MEPGPAPTTLTAARGASVTYTLRLTNHGPLAGRQRVLAFARPKARWRAGASMPRGWRQRLWAYAGAELAVGASARLRFNLAADALAQADHAGQRVLLPGEYEIVFSDGAHEVAAGSLHVAGAPTVVESSAFRAQVEAA